MTIPLEFMLLVYLAKPDLQKHEELTHFFLSMLYGSEADLGLDPTMTIYSAKDNEIPRYNIVVRVVDKPSEAPAVDEYGAPVLTELVYRTTQLINDDGAKAFRGSGTRVWEVVPVVDGVEQETRHVLKDHWVDDDRKHEGEILEEILNEESLSEEDKEELTALFLTQVARGDVYIRDEQDGGEKRDGTRTLATRGEPIPAGAATFSLFATSNYKSSHAAKSNQTAGGESLEDEKDYAEGTVITN